MTTPLAASPLGLDNVIGLSPWEETEIAGEDGFLLRVTAVPAQHGPDGIEGATGPVTGFVLSWVGQQTGPIYISGDTVPFAGTAEIARRYAPVGLAILHLGRVQLAPMGDLMFSLSAEQATDYAQALDARAVVPIHFEGWRRFTQGRDAAREVFDASPVAARTRWLAPGESASFDLYSRLGHIRSACECWS